MLGRLPNKIKMTRSIVSISVNMLAIWMATSSQKKRSENIHSIRTLVVSAVDLNLLPKIEFVWF